MQKQKEQDNLFQICYREGEGKIMKKIMAVVLMGALLLTGCGSSGEDAKNNSMRFSLRTNAPTAQGILNMRIK